MGGQRTVSAGFRAQNSNPSQPAGAINGSVDTAYRYERKKNIADAQFRSEISEEDEPAFFC